MAGPVKRVSIILVKSYLGELVQYRPDGRILRGISETVEYREPHLDAAVRGIKEELGLRVLHSDLVKLKSKSTIRKKKLYWFYIYKCELSNPPLSFPIVTKMVSLLNGSKIGNKLLMKRHYTHYESRSLSCSLLSTMGSLGNWYLLLNCIDWSLGYLDCQSNSLFIT